MTKRSVFTNRKIIFILFRPCPFDSEENVWKLCEQVKKTRPAELSKCYAVFVSNEGRTVPLWRQKAGRGDDKVVIWVSKCFVLFTCFCCWFSTVFCAVCMIESVIELSSWRQCGALAANKLSMEKRAFLF